MHTLAKKEVRLLLPSWAVASALALLQGITKPYDPYVAFALFVGLTIMALTVIGRETSLNTFSALLAQPVDRTLMWKSKLTVLTQAFASVFAIWLIAFAVAYIRAYAEMGPDLELRENSYDLFIAICLIATATFTGGLWTTLLLRQTASAFWLTLLVPVTLSGFSGIFLAGSDSSSLVIAILSVVIGIYSLIGFFLARWLFFRAQDVGWSGGVIALPEWKFLSAGAAAHEGTRARRPVLALIRKEIQLQQGVLTGAAGLFVLHAGVVGLRIAHHFPKDSAGDALTSITWMLWLVLPALVGSIAVAEERKLGMMDSQLCLPVSRRRQFTVKLCVTLLLGVLLGGIMPVVLESFGLAAGVQNTVLTPEHGAFDRAGFAMITLSTAASLSLVSFFGSTLARNFLQAIGVSLVAFLVLGGFAPAGLVRFSSSFVPNPIVTLVVTLAVLVVVMTSLAYANFVNFRDGWPLWRRNLGGLLAAGVVSCGASAAIYHRAWEAVLPAEPAHGAAKLSLANPVTLRCESFQNLLVRLPDGRVWFDCLDDAFWHEGVWWNLARMFNPLPRSAGPARFITGSNWADADARHVKEEFAPSVRERVRVNGYTESVGIKEDGTLWVSDKSDPKSWTADKLTQFGAESDWRQLARGFDVTSVLLLKKDGTLWRWGTNYFDMNEWPQDWPGLRSFQPYQIGTGSNWVRLLSGIGPYAVKADGSLWMIRWNTNHQDRLSLPAFPDTKAIVSARFFTSRDGNSGAYIRPDGTLWVFGRLEGRYGVEPNDSFKALQCSGDTNWFAVARNWDWLVALKSDGTLWQWPTSPQETLHANFSAKPIRLGIHHDWVSLVTVEGGVLSLAADGSLWFWPDPGAYDRSQLFLALPKQPQFIANVFEAEQ